MAMAVSLDFERLAKSFVEDSIKKDISPVVYAKLLKAINFIYNFNSVSVFELMERLSYTEDEFEAFWRQVMRFDLFEWSRKECSCRITEKGKKWCEKIFENWERKEAIHLYKVSKFAYPCLKVLKEFPMIDRKTILEKVNAIIDITEFRVERILKLLKKHEAVVYHYNYKKRVYLQVLSAKGHRFIEYLTEWEKEEEKRQKDNTKKGLVINSMIRNEQEKIEMMQGFVDTYNTRDTLYDEYAKIYNSIMEGIRNKDVLSVKRIADPFYEHLNELEESFGLDSFSDATDVMKIYYLGQLKGVTSMIADLAKDEEEKEDAINLDETYTHLKKLLLCISKNPGIDTIRLSKVTGLNTNVLYKFFKKMEKFDLFYIHKENSETRYHLTPKGIKYKTYIVEHRISLIKDQIYKEFMETTGLSIAE